MAERIAANLSGAAQRVLSAAEAFGDARVASERATFAWRGGDGHDRLTALSKRSRETLDELEGAARAYATSTRAKRTKLANSAARRASDA